MKKLIKIRENIIISKKWIKLNLAWNWRGRSFRIIINLKTKFILIISYNLMIFNSNKRSDNLYLSNI